MQANLVRAPTNRLGEHDTCTVCLMVYPQKTGRHGFDGITIGQGLTDLVVGVYSETPTITPSVPRVNDVLCPGYPTMHMADVGLLYRMCDKKLLDGRIGVCMM